MGRVMRRIDSKVKVLTRWSNESVDSYNQIQLQWKAFNDLLATLKEKISQQVSFSFSPISNLCKNFHSDH